MHSYKRTAIVVALLTVALLVFAAKPFNEVHIANFERLDELLKETALLITGTVIIEGEPTVGLSEDENVVRIDPEQNTVRVNTSEEEPLVVRAIDDAAAVGERFQIQRPVASAGPGDTVSSIPAVALGVPSDRLLVIEHVSAQAQVTEPLSLARVNLVVYQGEDCSASGTHPVVFGFQAPFAEDQTVYSASHPLLAFHDTSCFLEIVFRTTGEEGRSSLLVTITGFMIEK